MGETTAVPGPSLTLITRWQKQPPPQPVKIFIHLTGPGGEIVSQWDGLGAAWEGWQSNAKLLQLAPLPLPPVLPPGDYQSWAGLYHPETGERWLTKGEDRALLFEINVEEERAE